MQETTVPKVRSTESSSSSLAAHADECSGSPGLCIDTGTQELLCNLRERVLTITFNRPASRNALSSVLSPALRRLLSTAADDSRVGAVVLTGTGDAFCAGGDVKGMDQSNAAEPEERATLVERVCDLQRRQRELTGALVALRQPTIAALPGPAVGAGLAIALACDLRIAAETAFVMTGYSRVGLSGDYGISWLLTRTVGTARARELLFTSARVGAHRAEAIGLVNRVVKASDLQAEAFALARELANGPQDALRAMKSNLDEALASDFLSSLDVEAERLVACAMGSDHAEAVRAFVEKRQPLFLRQ